MSDVEFRIALQALVDDRLAHFGVYDPCVCIDDLEILLEEHGATPLEWGVQWDSKGAGPSGERPWHPIEKVSDQETAEALAETAIRPWTSPRVVKRTAPSDWEAV